ncbi:hypothetical protein LFL96_34315 [Paraburkholderia sp. D15]|uniref:hypothetical protein n=1 Tax=Paraburkholderia sp. D15 TaxID=2880218 RepID=UPI002479DFDE|nr:hypothetical protein [Paraburkholderia sp. D15]WGS53240.1 hypothetical protein LFL96_34315 [Paraburkholderia sp. D15]
MTRLLARTIPRTLTQLVARFAEQPATRIEAWLFEDEAARRDAERTLAAAGVRARLHAAYKPLLHFFLEDVDARRANQIEIRTPGGQAQRFRLEAYPLASLFESASVRFADGDDASHYVVTVDGKTSRVFAPNDATHSPCGWLRVWDGDTLIEDAPLHTEFEQVIETAQEAIAEHAWLDSTPYFDTLEIAVATTGIERPLAYGLERVSTFEALHEDLYYGVLEWFQARAGLPAGDRTLQPGQIVPDITVTDGDTTVVVALKQHALDEPPPDLRYTLDTVTYPLTPTDVQAELARLPGARFGTTSWQGRRVDGVYVSGSLPGLAITAGQHANESSGIVGALRAAHVLNGIARAHYALVPLENPDGAALHRRLRATQPTHIAHAARYTALGDDLEARTAEPFGEKAARLEAIERSGARLHLSLHGYPAHEWTRPRAGYVPKGNELWTVPKGFFLILRHHPEHDGLPFLRALTGRLAESKELTAFNARQAASWRAHVGDLPFETFNGIQCLVYEDTRSSVPYTLIAEFPDETIYDEAFQLAHTTQMRTVVEAARLYWDGLLA